MSAEAVREVNFDGLVGPTHNYAGLAFGNLAATENAARVSNPRAAAKQGLRKMRLVRDLGLTQGVLPPHPRPFLPGLRAVGFSGSDEDVAAAAARLEPELFRNAMSASAMWTANAATVSPAADTADGRTHFTPANLVGNLHRSFEAPTTARVLRSIFSDEARFAHHEPLPPQAGFGDEGAANHNRFCSDYGAAGLELFVYGRRALGGESGPRTFPARQTREASAAIVRLHGLAPARTVFVRQNPEAIDAGAFHNDVVAVANRNVFFYHQQAFEAPRELQESLRAAAPDIDFRFLEVPAEAVSLEDAVRSYLFNSQLVAGGDGGMILILPEEARETASTHDYVQALVSGDSGISEAKYIDVRESMRNGGGPACLRLRVVLSDADRQAVTRAGARVFLDDPLFDQLDDWIGRHYRDRLAPDDLADLQLMRESFAALDELTGILGLGPVYFFQR